MAGLTNTARAPAAPRTPSRALMPDDIGKLLLRLTLGALMYHAKRQQTGHAYFHRGVTAAT